MTPTAVQDNRMPKNVNNIPIRVLLCLFLHAAQPAGTGNTGSAQPPTGEGQPGNQPGNPPGGGEMGTSYIQVTPEERQAIERVRD